VGFFSKVFKSVGKVFKKIGKGIKSAFKRFGKFMNKIGIVGRIAMMFILPGIGDALASGIGSALGLQGVQGMSTLVSGSSGAGGLLGSSSAILKGAGHVLKYAGKVASMPGKVFSSITNGLTTTIKEFSKTLGSKLGLKGDFFADASKNFFGEGSAFTKSLDSFKSPFTAEQVASAAEKVTNEVDAPIKPVVEEGKFIKASQTIDDPSFSLGKETIESISQKDFEALGFSTKGNVGDIAYNFGDKEMFADVNVISNLNKSGLGKVLMPFQTGERVQKSLLSRVGDIGTEIVKGVKGLPEKALEETKSFFDDPFGDISDKATMGLQSKTLQTLGLEDKPMAPVYNEYASYIPPFETAPQESYGAPEIMNARAFEQQVTTNPNPFGFTAFQYNQYMNRFTTA